MIRTQRADDALAPLTPNACLRADLVGRLLPPDITDVLEVGCGQGSLGTRLARQYNYLGLEPDEESRAVAEQRLAAVGSGEVSGAWVADLDPARTFDLVCAFEVLEHIEDDKAALAEWVGRLRPGGWILLSVPAHQSRFGPADTLVGHFRRYDPAVMEELLRGVGLTDVTTRLYGMPLGYLLEAVRNQVGKRRLAKDAAARTVEERTAGSGRFLQPGGGLRGTVTRWGTGPFRLAQRAFPNVGPGLVARARLPR